MTMNENDKQAEPVAWRINFGNGFHSAWVDGKPSEKVLNHWLKQGRKLDFAYTRPAQPVQPDDLRQAALIDLAYINGAKAGWNMCVADDESQFQKLTEGVAECVNVLKNTRSQATAQPVQADHTGLIKRIDAAIERVTQGRGLMSIPADPRSDVDLVLSECKALLQGENPPFWATDFHPAQPVRPDFSDAYQGAREDAEIWKKRALEAEELNRKFIAEINGQTFMGEPAQPVQTNQDPCQNCQPGTICKKPSCGRLKQDQPVQPAGAQEPVAWAETDEHGEIVWGEEGCFSNDPAWIENPIPLYTEAPAAAINERVTKYNLPPLPKPAEPSNGGQCCGNFTSGGEYLGQSETICCGQFEEVLPDYYTAAQMWAYARAAIAQAEAAKGGAA